MTDRKFSPVTQQRSMTVVGNLYNLKRHPYHHAMQFMYCAISAMYMHLVKELCHFERNTQRTTMMRALAIVYILLFTSHELPLQPQTPDFIQETPKFFGIHNFSIQKIALFFIL